MTDTRLELRLYQKRDVRRALTQFNGRLLLKHTQGLGKSVIATRACEESPGVPLGPVVVICRTHLIIQWIKHIQKEYPDARIGSVVEQTAGGRWRALSQSEKDVVLRRKAGTYDFYVLTFATIRRVKRTRERAQAQGQRTMKQMWADAAEENGWTKKKPTARRPPFEYKLPPCRSLIIDECFTNGARIATPSGIRRIEDVRVGDYVWGRNDKGTIIPSRVNRVFEKPTYRELLPFGEVAVTSNHLVWTENVGYKPRDSMLSSDIVLYTTLVESGNGEEEVRSLDVRSVRWGDLNTIGQPQNSTLLHSKLSEEMGVRESTRTKRASIGEFEGDSHPTRSADQTPSTSSRARQSVQRSQGESESDCDRPSKRYLWKGIERREWEGTDNSSTSSRHPVGMEYGTVNSNKEGRREEGRLSQRIQRGRRGLGLNDCHRDRRGEPQRSDGEGQGSEEESVSRAPWVEGNSIHQPRGFERTRSSGDGSPKPTLIYDLETETSNYFCEGVLVHNSHHLRGVKSQQYAGAYQLAVSTQSRKAAERVVLLSATPAWREQDDLYAQLRLLDPRKFSSYWSFVKRYCILDETDFGAKVVGGHAKRIAKLLEGYAITRDYADPDVQIAIPELIEEEVWTTLSDAGLRAYTKQEAKLVRERKAGFGVGSGISDFSHITAHDKNKLADLDEVISSVDGHFVIFCWYVETAKMLGRLYDLPVFTGKAEPVRIRDEVVKVNRYTRSEVLKTAGSCIATIGCIQEGVDLSHLRTMVFYETDFTFGAMDQVKTRLKRWRQDSSTDPVRCAYVLAAATIDEITYERSQGRGATEGEVLDELARLAEGREAHGVPQPT